jgi:hypothetical protein
MRLLNIVSSPRGAESASIAVANAFLGAYSKAFVSIDIEAQENIEQGRLKRRKWHSISNIATTIYVRALLGGNSILVVFLQGSV